MTKKQQRHGLLANKTRSILKNPIILIGFGTFTINHVMAQSSAIEPAPYRQEEVSKEEAEKFIEPPIALPAPPKTENLLAVNVPLGGVKFFVDKSSIWIDDKAQLVRYTLVTEGEGGKQQAQYEGIRCNTKNYRSYAFLQTQQTPATWRQNSRETWIDIDKHTRYNRIHATLAFESLCKGAQPAYSIEEAIRRIKSPPQQVN